MSRFTKKIESYSEHVVIKQVEIYEKEGWQISLKPEVREIDKYGNKIWSAEMKKERKK